MKSFAGAAPTAPVERSYQAFAAPEDILVDHDLAAGERRRLVDAWKRELERANDSDTEIAGRPQDLLRRVNACRRLLSEEEH
jgi:hypothetical protein